MSARAIGLDIATHVFQVHGADASGKSVLNKRLGREQLADFARACGQHRYIRNSRDTVTTSSFRDAAEVAWVFIAQRILAQMDRAQAG